MPLLFLIRDSEDYKLFIGSASCQLYNFWLLVSLKNHGAVGVFAGYDIGAHSFLVTSCGVSKKSFVHGRAYAAIAWMRKSSELIVKGKANFKKPLDSRLNAKE